MVMGMVRDSYLRIIYYDGDDGEDCCTWNIIYSSRWCASNQDQTTEMTRHRVEVVIELKWPRENKRGCCNDAVSYTVSYTVSWSAPYSMSNSGVLHIGLT